MTSELDLKDLELPETFLYEDQLIRYGIAGEGPPLVLVHGTPWSA
jgi:hypothetical protein